MEEIYIVKLKGLPPPSISNSAHCYPQNRLPDDRKTTFYLTTDLTAEAVRGLSYLHIFLGLTILCLSITNLCFNENPWLLEPPLGITLWCALTFIILGFFGILAAYQRQCNLSRSIIYVRVYFLFIIIAISVTLTFVILFILDLHGPVANHLIGINILFSMLVETIVLLLTLFTCARILWPSCIPFCAKDWPMQSNLKRKVIVKTKVFANGIDNSDEAIQSVGPNCVISLNMPATPMLSNGVGGCDRDAMSTATAITSPISSTFHVPFERTPSPKMLGCQAPTMATSVTTLHTIQSSSSTVDSGHCDDHHHHSHQLSSAASSSSSSSSSTSHFEDHHRLSHGLQSAISSQSINHPHLGSSSSFPLQTFAKSTSSGLQSSNTNMNQLLYQSTILRRSYLADSDVSLEQQCSKSDNQMPRLYDSDEFDYCTTDDDDEPGSGDGSPTVDITHNGTNINDGGGHVTLAQQRDDDLSHCHELHNEDNNEIAHCSTRHGGDAGVETHHVRSLSAAGSDQTSSDEGHGSVDSSSEDAKSESSKSVTDENESVHEMASNHNQIEERHPTEIIIESIDEGIGGETINMTPTSSSPIHHSLKQTFIGNYEKCSKIPAPISIPKASIQKSDSNSNLYKPSSIRVLSNSKESSKNSSSDKIATTTTLLKTYGSKLSSHPYLNRLKATSAIGESAVLDRRYSKDKTGSAITIPDIERV